MCKKYWKQIEDTWSSSPSPAPEAPSAPSAPAPVAAPSAPVRGMDADSGAVIKKDMGGDPNSGSDIFSVDKKKKRRLGVPGLGI